MVKEYFAHSHDGSRSKETSKLKVLVETAEVEQRNHCASSVGNLLRPELVGWVAELKCRSEAIQTGKDTAV